MVLADMKFMAIFHARAGMASSSGCSRRAAPPTPSTTGAWPAAGHRSAACVSDLVRRHSGRVRHLRHGARLVPRLLAWALLLIGLLLLGVCSAFLLLGADAEVRSGKLLAAIGSADMQESIQWQMESYRAVSHLDQLGHRGTVSLMMQTLGFFFFIFWRVED